MISFVLLKVYSAYSMGLYSPSLRFLIFKTGVWDRIFHPAYPCKRSPFQAKHASSVNRLSHSLVSSQAWLFSVEYICVESSGTGLLQTHLNIPPIVCPTWGGAGLPASLWDQFWDVLTDIISLQNLFAATPEGELYETIPCYPEAVPHPNPSSCIPSVVGNTRAEKTRGPCRTFPLWWSWRQEMAWLGFQASSLQAQHSSVTVMSDSLQPHRLYSTPGLPLHPPTPKA